MEEDAFCYTNRDDFDFIIGSCHYFNINGKFFAIDSSYEYFKKCLNAFNGNTLQLAEGYYSKFCDYILKRKPDIIGHFDLITKFDQMDASIFLEDKKYNQIAEKYLRVALKSDCIFEVNTGAISRGYRTTPYPDINLLHILKSENGKLILSSDSHSSDTLDFAFKETREFLKDIGFQYVYTLYNNQFIKDYL